MSSPYSDTVHGRFIEHMDLARAWARWCGLRPTEHNVLGLMDKLDIETLRRLLAERERIITGTVA